MGEWWVWKVPVVCSWRQGQADKGKCSGFQEEKVLLSDRSARRDVMGKASYENTMRFVCYQYTDLRSGSGIVYKTQRLKERGERALLRFLCGNGSPAILGMSWHRMTVVSSG
jgi:hypothetical protein